MFTIYIKMATLIKEASKQMWGLGSENVSRPTKIHEYLRADLYANIYIYSIYM